MSESVKHGHAFEAAGKPEDYSHNDQDDDYYYHVAPHQSVQQIKKSGLHPRTSQGSMDHGFYADYSKGKAFYSEKSGVHYWGEKIGNHLESQFDNPPKLKVVRFPKHWVKPEHHQKDELGTRDSGSGSYYSTHPVTDPNRSPDPLAKDNLKAHVLFHYHPVTKKAKVLATSDSEDELKRKREELHQKDKYNSWDTKVKPRQDYEYEMNKHRRS